MSELVSGPGKTTRQSSFDRPVRHLWRAPSESAPTRSATAFAQRPADISRIRIHPPEQAEMLNSPGSALDASSLRAMQPHFGDLRHVRVHTDARANASADRLDAAAYTYKNHVVFAAGRFRPGTRASDDLLAHELVHVAQQRGVAEGGSVEVAASDHPLERNARAVLAGNSMLQAAPHAMLMRQGANEQMPSLSLTKPGLRQKERPSIMSAKLGFHLLPADRQTISDFLLSGNLEVGPDLLPRFQGKAMSLDEITDLAQSLVLSIVPRDEIRQFVTGKFLGALLKITELPGLPPMTFMLPRGADVLADRPAVGGGGGAAAEASEWQAAVGGQWTYHMNHNASPQTSRSVQVQFQHGSGALVEVFQYQVDLDTRVVQPMGGLQLQYSKSAKVLGVVLQGTAFLQLMAGLTQAPGSLSGDITVQVQGGLQGTATFGKVSVALQLGISLTLQGSQKPAWDTNVAPQAGGPDTFGMIETPGGGQVAGLTLRF